MAQIRTIDNQRHNVRERKEEIDELISRLECIETGILKVNMQVHLSSYEKGEETVKYDYEPVSFIRQNIMMYY